MCFDVIGYAARRWNEMHKAVLDNLPALVSVLIELGAPPDARDFKGRTALHLAVGTGALTILQVLVHEGRAAVRVPTPLCALYVPRCGDKLLVIFHENRSTLTPPTQRARLPATTRLL